MFSPGIENFEAEKIKAAAPDHATPFEGSYRDGQLTFTRFLSGNLAGRRQEWRGRVSGSGSSLHTTGGQWSGYGAGPGYTDFQATFTGSR